MNLYQDAEQVLVLPRDECALLYSWCSSPADLGTAFWCFFKLLPRRRFRGWLKWRRRCRFDLDLVFVGACRARYLRRLLFWSRRRRLAVRSANVCIFACRHTCASTCHCCWRWRERLVDLELGLSLRRTRCATLLVWLYHRFRRRRCPAVGSWRRRQAGCVHELWRVLLFSDPPVRVRIFRGACSRII